MFFLNMLIIFSIILEMLPISSSTHIYMMQFFLFGQKNINNQLRECIDLLTHGPILIVIALFFLKRWYLLLIKYLKNSYWALHYIWCGFIVEIITLLFYLVIYFLKVPFSFAKIGFLITSAALLSERLIKQDNVTQWNWHHSILLGAAQGISFLPGVSRLGLTFAAARWCGFARRNAFELSFMIEAPISAAAFAKGIYDCREYAPYLLSKSFLLSSLVGIILSYFLLCLVYSIIKKGYWWLFGLYTLFCAACLSILR